MKMTISIAGLNKADVLAALYNASTPLGMGFLAYDSIPMTREIAEDILKTQTRFDYLKGRVMKLDLSTDVVVADLYDRDNGQGAAQKVIDILRRTSNVNADEHRKLHVSNTMKTAVEAKKLSYTKSHVEGNVFTLGADELGEPLRDAITKATEGDEE